VLNELLRRREHGKRHQPPDAHDDGPTTG
jgi:hypothetical protein